MSLLYTLWQGVYNQEDNMAYWDWERFGEDIRRTVQDAVDSRDFQQLNQTIINTINQAADGIGRGVHDVGDAVNRSMHDMKRQGRRAQKAYQRHPYREDSRENARMAGGQARQGGAACSYQSQVPALYKRTGGMKAAGMALALAGYICGGGLLSGIAISAAMTFAVGGFSIGLKILLSIGIILTAVCAVLAGAGTSILGKVKRFRTYIQGMEGKEYCEIKELAETVRKSPKYIAKDIEKMIEKGWFRQGHLDNQRTCLMVTNAAYRQYIDLMKYTEEKKRMEREQRKQKEQSFGRMDPQVKEIIRTGDEYIRKIHECNDAIPDVEISAKISRMETLVDRIFERVEQNPETVPEIRRLMEYYLPTTVKLLEAYEELDSQPVQGDNILSSKQEIERTLDTLNIAFEKLLDSLFQDTAWDVSADISVLNTMLAQEGLTKDDF